MNNHNRGLLYQMNVTPFIDVMLVLLVIFMISSSVMIADFQVNLPSSTAAQERITVQSPDETLTVNILRSGNISVQSKELSIDDLPAIISQLKEKNNKISAIINADNDVSYGRVTLVMDVLRKNGITRVSLATKLMGVDHS